MKLIKLVILCVSFSSSVLCMEDMEDQDTDEFLQLSKEKLLEVMVTEFVTAKFALEQFVSSMKSLRETDGAIPDEPTSVPPACFLKHEKQVEEANKIIAVAWELFEKDLKSETEKSTGT